MKAVHVGKATEVLKEIPKPPAYLDSRAKSHFKKLAKTLISSDLLKRIHEPALAVMAENFSQWEWAIREIRRKNKEKEGSGYRQKYSSGAQNISVELTIKRDAEKAIMQCFKQFGLDPRSEKDLKAVDNSGQTNLFEEFNKLKNAK